MRSALLLLFAVLFSGCDRRKPLHEGELPSSHRNSTLAEYRPPEILAHLAEWHPGDWRVHLLQGLTDPVADTRLAALHRADSLNPADPLPAYCLAVHHLAGDSAQVLLAKEPLAKALALDPENGVLQVMHAFLLLQEGEVPRARALFMDPRRAPSGSFYHARLEEVVLGLLSHTRQLNPYTLTEAAGLYRAIPLPPIEKVLDILYAVFLSPLPDRPYDIRIRGKQAADGLYHLGGALRIRSYGGRNILSGGHEQRALGYMFQLRAAEFLTLFHRAFEDIPLSRTSFEELVRLQEEYEIFMSEGAWQDSLVTGYLDRWDALIRTEPSLTLGEAVERARVWPLWRRTRFYRYPASDDLRGGLRTAPTPTCD